MNLKQASANLGLRLVHSLREGDGSPVESDTMLNDASREVILAMHEEHGEAWLGRINVTEGEAVFEQWTGGELHNFCAAFVLPRYDAGLEHKMRERLATSYTGTKADRKLVTAIYERVKELGGELLVWS